MYLIGIDSSANFSRLVAIDISGKPIGHHIGGSVNLKHIPRESVRDNLKKLILEFNRLTNTKYDECGALCIGTSFVNNKERMLEMERVLGELGLNCPVKAVNELELILAAECAGKPGTVVYSGVDSCAFALDKKKAGHRIGGYGHLIDGGGSGYWIGVQAIKAVLMAYDGRAPRTSLTELMRSSFRIKEISKIVEIIYSDKFNKAVVVELAQIVKNAAANGDAAADDIENRAAAELYRLAQALIERFELADCAIVLCGPVLQMNDRLRGRIASLAAAQYKGITVTKPNTKPEMGAAYLALGMYEARQ